MRGLPTLGLVALLVSGVPSPANAGDLLVVNKSGDSVSIIDSATREELRRIATGVGPHEVEVSADGRIALVSNYGSEEAPGHSLTVIDLVSSTTRTIDLGEHGRPHGIAWLDSGRAAVTTEGTNSIVLVDVLAGRVLESLETGGQKPHMLVANAAGTTLWVASIESGTITKASVSPLRVESVVRCCEGAEGIALAASGKLWVAGNAEGVVRIYDAASMQRLASVPVDGMPIRVELVEGRNLALITAATSGEITVIDATSFEVLGAVSVKWRFDLARGRFLGGGFGALPVPVGAQQSADGATFYVANSFGGVIVEVDASSFEVLGEFVAGAEPDGMALVRP